MLPNRSREFIRCIKALSKYSLINNPHPVPQPKELVVNEGTCVVNDITVT